jgi:hypothetical protein
MLISRLQEAAPAGVNYARGVMRCTICVKHCPQSTDKFVVGTRRFRKPDLTAHAGTEQHQLAMMKDDPTRRAEPSPMQQYVEKASAEQKAAVEKLLYQQLMVDMSEIPHRNLKRLRELTSILGVKDSALYTDNNIPAQLSAALSDTIEENIVSELQASPFYALIADETTDVANKKDLIVYAIYLKDGLPVTRYLRVCYLRNGKADTIYAKLRELISELKLEEGKLIAFGSDGLLFSSCLLSVLLAVSQVCSHYHGLPSCLVLLTVLQVLR